MWPLVAPSLFRSLRSTGLIFSSLADAVKEFATSAFLAIASAFLAIACKGEGLSGLSGGKEEGPLPAPAERFLSSRGCFLICEGKRGLSLPPSGGETGKSKGSTAEAESGERGGNENCLSKVLVRWGEDLEGGLYALGLGFKGGRVSGERESEFSSGGLEGTDVELAAKERPLLSGGCGASAAGGAREDKSSLDSSCIK